MKKATILIVDDAISSLFLLTSHLESWGYSVLSATEGKKALDILGKYHVDLVISDQVMPEMDGIELLKEARSVSAEIPFIILTAHGTIHSAVSSIRRGANDYLEKPYDPETLHATIERTLEFSMLRKEHGEMSAYLSSQYGFHSIVTRSPRMETILDMAKKVAANPLTTVNITGESGTGKELLARAIHLASDTAMSRFIPVNCAAIPAPLLESELFGHVKGAFTGADRNQPGKFELADNGTLLLDEVGDMPLEIQAKLLRVLEDRSFQRVGSTRTITADFRIISTTHYDLEKLVENGRFREDLFHRLNRFPLCLPPLRERREDIPILTEHFLGCFRRELGKQFPGVSPAALTFLNGYSWPGNIRELRNCLERAVILNEGRLIEPEDFSNTASRYHSIRPAHVRIDFTLPASDFSLATAVDKILSIALERCDNNKSRAAELLQIDRKMFYRR